MTKTSIEWTEESWNPIVGCSVLSPGCSNCYAMRLAARVERMNQTAADAGKLAPAPQYVGTTSIVHGKPVWTGKLALSRESVLMQPLHRRKPTLYFVNSMGDLFHEAVPFEWIRKVFGIMSRCPQHTFQILTKRAARMREVVQWMIDHPMDGTKIETGAVPNAPVRFRRIAEDGAGVIEPLPNVWLGVSTERQQEADERIPHLLATPAAVRFISAEPLLGPISLRWAKWDDWRDSNGKERPVVDHLDGARMLDWVIVGGESGPGSRPMHPDWARSLRNECLAAGVPFFFKQWGNWHPEIDRDRDDPDWRQPYADYREPTFQILNLAGGRGFHGERVHVMRSCSKKSAGRTLDGMIHDEMPEVFQGRLSPVGKTREGAEA